VFPCSGQINTFQHLSLAENCFYSIKLQLSPISETALSFLTKKLFWPVLCNSLVLKEKKSAEFIIKFYFVHCA
jgi:hypothetical protein